MLGSLPHRELDRFARNLLYPFGNSSGKGLFSRFVANI
ncbi:hypothetical protein BBG7_0040 [Bifidobacterium longum]|nr:hypothetical protein BBG7_0040 [Bifidobacterium longum]QCH29645.1 Hypothetical protein Blongum51A_0042 [Bifidobacterium longum]